METENRSLLSQGYVSIERKGSHYLIPYGQKVALLKRAIKINDTGSMIWKLLVRGKTTEEIVKQVASYYQVDDEDRKALESDVHSFLQALRENDILPVLSSNQQQIIDYDKIEESNCESDLANNRGDGLKGSSTYQHIKMGPISLEYEEKDACISNLTNYFAKFVCDAKEMGIPIQKIQFIREFCTLKKEGVESALLVQTKDVAIYKEKQGYYFSFACMEGISGMRVSLDGTFVSVYYNQIAEGASEEIFHALRFAFLLLAQNYQLFLFHSASIVYRDKIWLFSGHSGAGKSTHTDLWSQYYHVGKVNGDLNMIGKKEGNWVVYGQPWCGTSGICSVEEYPLGGIIMVKKSAENQVLKQDTEKAMLSIASHLISPTWEKEQAMKNYAFADGLSKDIPVLTLYCTKEREAVDTMKQYIDSELF